MKVEAMGGDNVKVTGFMFGAEITIYARARKPRKRSDAEITISPNSYAGPINTSAKAAILKFLLDRESHK